MTSWPDLIFEKLREFGIRHVAYVPDAGLARLIELCQAADDMEPTVLTTEEEGIGILAGAWLGGERGALLMQSSGVGNCINALSLAKVCGFPLLMIITMRGEWGEMNPWQIPMGQITGKNPTARRRDRLRSDKTGSSSPDRRSGRTHLFQRRTRGRDSALAAHAWHKTFQRLTDGRREQAAASRRDRPNPGGTPGHAGGNWAGLADV